MTRKNDDFALLMDALAREEGARLLRENEAWRDRVPEKGDRAVRAGLAALGAGLAAAGVRRSAGLLRRVLLPLLAGVTAAAVAAGGVVAAVPSLRESFCAWLSAPGGAAAVGAARSPGDYLIPAPGEDFTLREESRSDTVQYKWFEAGERAALVELALRLPEDGSVPESAEPAAVGSLRGFCWQRDAAWYLTLTDGEVSILISLKNADREALFTYAALFAAANGL